MQVSDQVRFVVDAIAERVRLATYEASAYRTQRQRFEGNDAASNMSSTFNNNNNVFPHHHSLQNQQQLLLINDTPLFQSPATHLSVAQTQVNANRQDIVDYAMKRVASSPASTRVAHDKKAQQQSVFDDLLQQNSQRLTYQMAMQTLKNVQSEMEFNHGVPSSSLPPRSPPPPQQQQQQQQTLRPTFLDENKPEETGDDFLNGTQKPSSSGSASPSRTKTFVTNLPASDAKNYGQLQWQNKNSNGIVMTGLLVPSVNMRGRDVLAQRQVDEVLFGKKTKPLRANATSSSSTYKHPTSSSLSRSSYSLNAPRNSKQVFVRTTTTMNASSGDDEGDSYLLHRGTEIPLPTTQIKNNNNHNLSSKFSYEAGFISDATAALMRREGNTSNNNNSTNRESRSPESAMGGRTAAPTATSSKIFSASNYQPDVAAERNTSVGALRNHRNVSGFVEYNPEYEKFRQNVQTSLRAASDTTRFLSEEQQQ